MSQGTYKDLIFQLGDLAREHLAEAKSAPRAMEKVFAAEDLVLALREDIENAEQAMNDEDTSFKDFVERIEVEKIDQQRITKKWAAAVSGVETRSRDLKKKISSQKAAHRYQKKSMKLAEEKHRDLEQREGHDLRKLALSADNLKKFRLQIMRDRRHIDDLEFEFKSILTPRPGQTGAQGILAHARLLEMEDESEERKAEHEDLMTQLDSAVVAKEDELKLAEEDLDSALYELGEEVYADRLAHPKLSPLYPKVDKAK